MGSCPSYQGLCAQTTVFQGVQSSRRVQTALPAVRCLPCPSWPWGHRHTRTAVSTLPAPCAHPLCWRTHTSLSKSWSGSDMLLRGTLTPGSEPPVDKDTRDLRERPRERWRVEVPPQQLPAPRYLMRAMRCRACSWLGGAEGGLEGQGPASPPGQWVQHSGEEQHRRVVCEHGPGAQWGCHNEG